MPAPNPAQSRISSRSRTESDSRRWNATRQAVAAARRQHGVVTLTQLNGCGLSDSSVRNWVATGRLHRVHAGVYALGRPDLPPHGHWTAAVLACGPGAYLSDASAAANHGIRASAASRIDVTITRPSSLTRPGIRIHRRTELTPADLTVVNGIPTTSLSRTLLDLAATRSITPAQLERACEQAVILRLFDMRAMSELLGRSKGARGIRRLRDVLARGDLGENVPASGLERRYRDLCARAGLPKPVINRWILLGDEYHQVDFLWRRERVVVEVDGRRYHSTGWKQERDARRDGLLAAHGYRHGRVSEDAIEHHPTGAVAAASELLANRAPRA